jgi:hypothetical protein
MKVRLRMTAPAFATRSGQNPTAEYGFATTAQGGLIANFRLVDGTQVNTVNFFGDSLWMHEYTLRGRIETPIFTATVSLAAGTYFAELQCRFYSTPDGTAYYAAHWLGGIWNLFATVEI